VISTWFRAVADRLHHWLAVVLANGRSEISSVWHRRTGDLQPEALIAIRRPYTPAQPQVSANLCLRIQVSENYVTRQPGNQSGQLSPAYISEIFPQRYFRPSPFRELRVPVSFSTNYAGPVATTCSSPISIAVPEAHVQRWPVGDVAVPTVCRLEFAIPPASTLPADGDVFADVSENLLEPFAEVRCYGKRYGLSGEAKIRRVGSGIRLPSGVRRPVSERERIPDIWDIVFPILKPPVHLRPERQVVLPHPLHGFQVTGIQRLINGRSFLLADEMGTGKTMMAVVALRMLFQKGQVQRALVVCPASLTHVWENHLREWADVLIVQTVRGNRVARQFAWSRPAHVYVVSYDSLARDALDETGETNLPAQWDVVVLDEAHHIRNPSSKRSRAIRRLNAEFRWALTGTPMQNRPEDLISLFGFLKPGLFAPKNCYSPDEVRQKVAPYFLRRRKCDVFTELPPKIRQDIWLDLDPRQREHYRRALEQGREQFHKGELPVTRIHLFSLLNRLKQICNFAPGQNDSPKTKLLKEQVEQIVSAGAKVIVFTQYLDEGIYKLEKLLRDYGVAVITGNTTIPQREQAVQQFNSHPKIRVLLTTPRTGGEGLTMTAASYVIHFDHWWNPAVAWQAEDRAHRIGQQQTVNVYSYWMRDTVEERIRQILERKGLLHERVVEQLSEQKFEEALSIEELCTALGLDYRRLQQHRRTN
jgi:superfamily II DNA or RNA helicase